MTVRFENIFIVFYPSNDKLNSSDTTYYCKQTPRRIVCMYLDLSHIASQSEIIVPVSSFDFAAKVLKF